LLSPDEATGNAACHCIELPFVFGTRETFRKAPMTENASLDHAAKSGAHADAASRPPGQRRPPRSTLLEYADQIVRVSIMEP